MDLRAAVLGSRSMAGTLRALGLRAAGGNYENIGRAIARLAIDIAHWTGKGHLKGRTNPSVRGVPIVDILRTGTCYQSNKLRKRLLKENIFARDAQFVGFPNGWENQFRSSSITSMVIAKTTAC